MFLLSAGISRNYGKSNSFWLFNFQSSTAFGIRYHSVYFTTKFFLSKLITWRDIVSVRGKYRMDRTTNRSFGRPYGIKCSLVQDLLNSQSNYLWPQEFSYKNNIKVNLFQHYYTSAIPAYLNSYTSVYRNLRSWSQCAKTSISKYLKISFSI